MAINLQKGQRISLEKSMTHALIGLGWDTNRYDGGADFDLDASVFLLGENDKLLRDEEAFILWGGKRIKKEFTENGQYFSPVILGSIPEEDDTLFVDQALPVLAIRTVATVDSIIDRAHSTSGREYSPRGAFSAKGLEAFCVLKKLQP